MPRVTLDSDALNGANNADLGSEWDNAYTGRTTIQLLSNHASPSVIATRCFETFNATVAGGDQWAEVTLTSANPAAYTNYILACRVSTPGTLTGYGIFVEATSLSLVKWVAGVLTVLTSAVVTRANGDVLSLECVGTLLTAYVNGVSKATATDADYATGRAGFGCFVDTGGLTSYVQLNTFAMGDFTTSGATYAIDLNLGTDSWDVFDASTVHAGGAPVGGWPNEPVGHTLRSDWNCDVLAGSGWADAYNGASYMSLVDNQNGPLSAPSALQGVYPIGHPGGSGIGNFNFNSAASVEFWIGKWVKHSSPFQQHPDGDKICYYVAQNGNQHPFYSLWRGNRIDLVLQGPVAVDNRHLPGVAFAGTCVLIGGGNWTKGVWHRLEVFLRESSTFTSQNGVARWWVDGVLAGQYTNLNTDQVGGFTGAILNPVYGGGLQVTKTEQDFIWYDHVRITGGAASSGGGGGTPPVLLSPPDVLFPNFATIPFGDITFTWNAVGGAASYAVRVHVTGLPYDPTTPPNFLFFGDVVGTSQLITVPASTTIDWWIHTRNSAGDIGGSYGATFSTTASPVPPVEPPVEPPPVLPPPVVPPPLLPPVVLAPPEVLGIRTTTTLSGQSRLNPYKKEFDFYG